MFKLYNLSSSENINALISLLCALDILFYFSLDKI